ncbi:hypothetical protein HDV00_005221 [Rhizophlyctis rosea]|nr:hypothetical protein HDV00_005221 [Rhizophlyctis rosea]
MGLARTLTTAFWVALVSSFTSRAFAQTRSRTTYSNGTARVGADTADPFYDQTGTGIVEILSLAEWDNATDPFPPTKLQQWQAKSNMQVINLFFPEGTTYDNYVSEILETCQNPSRPYDLVWVHPSYAGVLADCLLDLWAWDPLLGSGHDPAILQSGVVGERLVTLPAEASFGVLYYNKDVLDRYEITEWPADLDAFEKLCNHILQNEKAQDHFDLIGLAGPLEASENLTAWGIEWLASYNATLLSEHNVTVLSQDAADAFGRIANWIGAGILDELDIGSVDTNDAKEKFLNGKAIFFRGTPDMMSEIEERKSFDEWGMMPFPSQTDSHYVGTYEGWGLGVQKNAANPKAAMKTLKYMTSLEYQSYVIRDLKKLKVGTYPQMHSDDSGLCGTYPTITACRTFRHTTIVNRPSTLAGASYFNASTLFQNAIINIITGTNQIVTSLTTLDSNLRTLLHYAALDDSSTVIENPEGVAHPGKKVPSKVGTQMTGLLLIAGVTAGGIVIHRRVQAKKEEDAKKAGEGGGGGGVVGGDVLPGGVIPSGGAHQYKKLKDEENQEEAIDLEQIDKSRVAQ